MNGFSYVDHTLRNELQRLEQHVSDASADISELERKLAARIADRDMALSHATEIRTSLGMVDR
jgi:hypothetical protein